MSDRVLSNARTRYAVGECLSADPAREQYAASHRWLACARDALRWSRKTPSAESAWLGKTCEALVRAEEHRDAARRWRKGLGMTMRDAEDFEETDTESDPETRALEQRVREAVRARSAIVAYYAAARHALALARVYREEPTTSGRREDEVLAEVRRYRRAIGALRTGSVAPVESSRPGLRKAPVAVPEFVRKTAARS